MFTLDFISARGGLLPLVNNEYFWLAGADGLTRTNVALATSAVPSMDGDSVNNIQGQPRTIVLYLEVKSGKNVEEVKRYVTSFVKPKLNGTLRWKQNEREVEITGIVQAVEMPRFTKKCIMQISMYCSKPYWSDIDFIVTEIRNITSLHYFPIETGGLAFPIEGLPFGAYEQNKVKRYDNDGDVASGMTITITAVSTATKPTLHNLATGEFIGINDKLIAGDEVVITTYKGNKTITKNGENVMEKILAGSTFLQMEVGGNEFLIRCDEDENDVDPMYFTLTYKRQFV